MSEQMNYGVLVEKYVKLREIIATKEAEHKAALAPYKQAMDDVETALLKYFNESGIENIKTAAGTAYVSTKTTASVADWDALFNNFILTNRAWEFLERRVSKSAVEAFKEANEGQLPPGINYTAVRTVNIRKKD